MTIILFTEYILKIKINNIIYVKNLKFFENFNTKLFTNFLNHKNKSIFKKFFFVNKEKNSNN